MSRKLPTSSVWSEFKPPVIMRPSDWAEQHRVLTVDDSSRPGKISFKGEFSFQREILDTCYDHEKVVFMSSAQIGKTNMLLNLIAYYACNDPGSIMYVAPSQDQAVNFSRTRLNPMFNACRELSKLVDKSRRENTNNIFFKGFTNGKGSVSIVSALSPQSLRARPIRFLFLDEVSAYRPTEREGDTCQLAEARTKSFHARRIVYTSTPTLIDSCRITHEFEHTDKRYYMIPCPACGFHQRLVFENLIFDHLSPQFARYKCESCGHLIEHHYKREMVKKGKWVKTQPENLTPGFHISELYSPFRGWGEIAVQFLEAKQREDTLQVFTNTVLGLPFKAELTPEVDPSVFLAERITYPRLHLPEGVLILTCGIDVQANRFVYEIVGWTASLQTYSIDYGEILCPIGESEAFVELDKLRLKKFTLSSGKDIGISLTCIDAGYLPTYIYEYCRGKGRSKSGFGSIIPTRGQRAYPSMLGRSTPVDLILKRHGGNFNITSNIHRNSVSVFPIGVNVTKSFVMQSLTRRPTKNGEIIKYPEGYCFFDKRHDEMYFKQLLSERLVTRTTKWGQRQYWAQVHRENHLWDCRVYATAAASGVGVFRMDKGKWQSLRQELGYMDEKN